MIKPTRVVSVNFGQIRPILLTQADVWNTQGWQNWENNLFTFRENGWNLCLGVEFTVMSSVMCACMLSCSVVSDSLQPPGLQPARFLCSWEFPGKNTVVCTISYSRASSGPRD